MLKRCVFFLVTFTLKSFYNKNYGIIQGFPALRKSVTTHVKKCDIFPRVFDIVMLGTAWVILREMPEICKSNCWVWCVGMQKRLKPITINYGIIQGFPALRKSVTTHVKKCDIFPRVFDTGNQLLSRHSLRLMNERQSLHHSQSKVVCRNLFGLLHWKIRIAFRKWRSNFSSRKTNQNMKRKTESYVFSGFGNCSAADNENRQMEDLPQATDFGREPERSLLPVRTNSITEDFACWKLGPLSIFIVIQRML